VVVTDELRGREVGDRGGIGESAQRVLLVLVPPFQEVEVVDIGQGVGVELPLALVDGDFAYGELEQAVALY
jgi:hypothetical protein